MGFLINCWFYNAVNGEIYDAHFFCLQSFGILSYLVFEILLACNMLNRHRALLPGLAAVFKNYGSPLRRQQ